MDGLRAAEEREPRWVCGVHLHHANVCISYSLCLREPLASRQLHKARLWLPLNTLTQTLHWVVAILSAVA